jgi:anti-sigma-K factor RskA
MTTDESHMTGDDCAANAAPYVLGALTEEEHEEFVRHLESCAICREEVAALQVVASSLPAAVPQLSSSGELKERVMATVRQEASLHRPAAADSARSLAHARRRSLGGWVGWRPALAGAGVAAVVVALIAVALSSGGGGGGSASSRVIRAEVHAPRASATVRVSDGHAELDVADLPQAAPDRVYEVWIKRASGTVQPTDALFTVNNSGKATVGVPGTVTNATAIMVTSEPLGGTRVPTSSPLIVARLS